MSNLSHDGATLRCQGAGDTGAHLHALPGRQSVLGAGLTISRLLPHPKLRMIGAWCFLDHIGPVRLNDADNIDVAPHPHIGLQTATWMINGELWHKDSLGYEQVIRPGQLNLMTAGHGISHSEESPPQRSDAVHGVQFWIALPESCKDIAPAFEHIDTLPRQQIGQTQVTVFIGELANMCSPAKVYSPLLGAELVGLQDDTITLAVPTQFELGLLVTAGTACVDDTELGLDTLYALGCGRSSLTLTLAAGARVMLIGGAPYGKPVLMWWNFVGHSDEEIRQGLDDWENGDRFGEVTAYSKGTRLTAPALNAGTRLR